MDEQLPISVLVAVKNEEKNIRKCLDSLTPATEILVLDSGSTDATAAIAQQEYSAGVVQFRYSGGYPKKRQWALDHLPIRGDWILLIDADEVVPEALWREIALAIGSRQACEAYLVRKAFHCLGRRFRFGGFSHAAVVLMRRGCGRFEELVDDTVDGLDMEVHERVIVDGRVGVLSTPLEHEDFKGLEPYLQRHNQYSTWEARLRCQYLETGRYGAEAIEPKLLGNAQERRRWWKRWLLRLPFEPMVWFLYHYVLCLGFLEGRPGLIACRIRANYIFQVRAKMYEMRRFRTLS